jgi:hypothetical protein
MITFKNRREQGNMQEAAQRTPRHTALVGEVRASTRRSRLHAQQVIGGNQ